MRTEAPISAAAPGDAARWPVAKPLLLLSAAVFVLVAPALLTAFVMVPADLLDVSTTGRPAPPPAWNHLTSDVAYQAYPYHVFWRQEILSGRLPLWNPFSLAGTPFAANSVSAPWSPINWLLLPLPSAQAFEWAALVKLLLAASGVFFFCRQLGCSAAAAVTGGLAFALGGYNIFFLLYSNTAVSALAGWGLLATERLHREPNRRRLVVLGLLIGALYLGGHVQTALLLHLGWLGYGLVRNPWDLRRLAAASVLGVLIASLAIVPFAELVVASPTLAERSAFGRNPYHLGLGELPALVLPYFVGSPVLAGPVDPKLAHGAAYIGVLPLLLAALAWPKRRSNAVLWSLWIVAAAAAAILFGLPPVFDLWTLAPLLRQGNYFHIVPLLQAVVAVLAALGLDRWRQRASRPPGLLLAVAVAVVVVGWVLAPVGVQDHFFLFARFDWPLYPFWVLGTLGALAAALRWRRSAAVPGLIAVNAYLFGLFYNPVVAADPLYHPPPFLERLAAEPGQRFAAVGAGFLPPAYSMVWRASDVRGYEPVAPPGRAYLQLSSGTPGAMVFVENLSPESVGRLRRLGCSWVVVPAGFSVPAGLELVSSGDADLYRLGGPGRVSLLRRLDPEEETFPAAGSVRWQLDQPTRIELEVETEEEGWLLLRDTWFPGWQASVGGESAPIENQDGFRAVKLAAGRQRVGFEYRPLSFTLGAGFSLLGVLLAVVLASSSGRRSAQSSKR